MANAYKGSPGTVPRLVYTTPPDKDFALDSVTFDLHCSGSAAEHHAVVTYVDNSGLTAQVHKDWNVAADGAVIRYTFGIGLISSACTIVSGETVEHDLTNTVLSPNTLVEITSVDESGNLIAGDTVQNVVLYATQLGTDITLDPTPQARQPIYFMPGSAELVG